MKTIDSFQGQHRYLSNFSYSPVEFEGELYPSVEHAFQAAKSNDLATRKRVRDAGSPGEAKRLGRKIKLRADWNNARVGVMLLLLIEKFSQHPDLTAKLLRTGDTYLEEGNTWGDQFWGVCDGVGMNMLGILLMGVRKAMDDDISPMEEMLFRALQFNRQLNILN